MTEEGLENPNRPAETGKSKDQNSGYRYDDRKSLKDSIEAREKRLEEEKRRLEEDKKRLQKDSISSNSKKENMDDNDNEEGIGGFPVFSLIHVFN
jgi:hypothetical protein